MPRTPPGLKDPPSYAKKPPPPSPEDNRPGIGARKPPPRQAPKQAPSPEDIVHPSFSSPKAPVPTGPPVPILQQYGFHGSIHDVNDRVERITGAYQAKFGRLPSRGLVFDLLRSPADDFKSLFDAVPHSDAVARARGALVGHGPDPLSPARAPKPPEEVFIDELAQAAHSGELADFEKANGAELKALLDNPRYASKALAAMMKRPGPNAPPAADRAYAAAQLRLGIETAKQTGGERPSAAKLKAAGIVPTVGEFHSWIEPLALGISQVTESLAYAPAGLFTAGKAGYHDVGGAVHGDLSFKRTREIAKQTGKAVARDIRHPSENPGYLFMDVLGIASIGAGTGLRVARAGALVREGEVGGATRALLTRPVGGSYELRKGGHSEHVLLFENPIAQAAQRTSLKLRQRALDRREINPHGRQPLTSTRGIDLSSEAKMGREAEARRRVQTAIARTYTNELEKAAGWSLVASEVFARLPYAVRRAGQKLPGSAPHGLTRGEQKAIQVLATDDPSPLALHRDFHERMKLTPELGEQYGVPASQFIANHERHLADLKLAEVVLGDLAAGKARKRFATAVEQTQRVIAEQQRLKIEELGLLPDVAERRIIAPAEVMRTGKELPNVEKIQGEIRKLEGLLAARHVEERAAEVAPYDPEAVTGKIARLQRDLVAAERQHADFQRMSEESFYLPFVPKQHAKSLPRDLIRRARFGPFGVPKPRPLPELSHVFTGKSIIAGDFRIDATALAGEAYGKTVRHVSIRNDHARLMKMAKDTQAEAGPFAVPIRDVNDIDPALRERMLKIDEGEFTSKDADKLGANATDSILSQLYPNPADAIEGVKWVDARLIGDEGIRVHEGRVVGRTSQSAPGAGIADVVNEPFRLAYLFLRPAYALNLLGNAGMAVIHQGVFAPINLGRSLYAERMLGRDAARALDALSGEGKMQAIAATAGAGKLTAGSRAIGHAFSILTDRHFRRAAILHELRRQGFRTPEQIRAALFDETNLTKLVEAKRRANKAMVEFDNLTHYEKHVIRHFIFVYPWVSRSAVWSLRTLIEHPVQSAVLVQLGHQAQQDEDPLFAHMPDWIKRVGYIPVGYNADGSPRIINPTSINSFSTMNDLIQLASGGETPEDFASPLIEIGIRAFTGADQYGQRFKGKERFYGPFAESVKTIPLVAAFKGEKDQPATTPLDPADKRALVKREHEALKQSVTTSAWLGNWGKVIAGGLAPKELNLDAAAARYWRDQPLEARNKHERALIQQGLGLQGELLKEKVPKAVRESVDIAGEETLARAQRAKEIGRDVPASSKEGALVDIGVLQKRGKLSTLEAQDLTERLNKLPDTKAVTSFIRKLHVDHGGSTAIRDWQADVNLVASFTPEAVKARLEDLRKQGLSDGVPTKLDQGSLHELGRQVLAFQRELGRRSKAHENDPRAEKSIAQAELRAFQDSQDKPVKIGEHRYPSVVRLTWSMLTPTEQAAHRASVADAEWKSLSAFDKGLVGKKSSPDVTRGWANLARLVAAFRGQVPMPGVPQLPAGQKLQRNQLVYLVKYVEKGEAGYLKPSPGFFKDWLFAEQPKYRRLGALAPVQKSKFRPQWNHLFADANVLGSHLAGDVYSKAALREAWHGYVNSSEFQTWLAKTPRGFRDELDRYGPDFLPSLLN